MPIAKFNPPIHPKPQLEALAKLNLSQGEFDALRRQGFVSCERRRRNSRVYKLRFRFRGSQRVVYLGVDLLLADAVRAELAQWQQPRRAQLCCAQTVREASRNLKRTKNFLVNPLAERGYYFHGNAIRRRRNPQPAQA